MMSSEIGILGSLLLLSVFSSAGTSKTDEILDLITKLQGLVKKIKFSPSSGATSRSTTTSSRPTFPTTTIPAGFVNFARDITPVDPAANRKYCYEAVCPGIYCKEEDITKYGKLRRAVPIPKIYSLCSNTIRMFISMNKYDFKMAVTSCCQYNGTLQSLNAPDVISCFQELIKAEKKQKNIFWTSGIYSKECDAYVWCPEREIVSDVGPQKWRKGFPNRTAGECLAVQTGQDKEEENGLFNLMCNTPSRHMCYGSPEVMFH
ncbi:uncharacterized protein LOC135947897 [Cloeon dipterum]|uniref:uncharacterized protein LOC135947897 n=1 Tax=Cloeon dipterum TaxID=197152 RepID=UPI00321FB9A6